MKSWTEAESVMELRMDQPHLKARRWLNVPVNCVLIRLKSARFKRHLSVEEAVIL